jgi:hypothetical protein
LEDDGGGEYDEDEDWCHEPQGDLPVKANRYSSHIANVLFEKQSIKSKNLMKLIELTFTDMI